MSSQRKFRSLITVREAVSWKAYKEAWIKGMKHLHWFTKDIPFDYNKDEELLELEEDYNNTQNLFLEVIRKNEEIQGVLGIKIRNNIASFRRWEPAIPKVNQDKEIGKILIKKGITLLKNKGIKEVNCMLKYPFNTPEFAIWHNDLYKNAGFKKRKADGVSLLLDLSSEEKTIHQNSNIVIENSKNFSLDDFVNFTLKAFSSTKEDKAIHNALSYRFLPTSNSAVVFSVPF